MSSLGPRSTHPRVVLADNENVVVLWYQRAVGHDGRRLDTPVPGLCRVRDGRLARAQMSYFDTADIVRIPAAGTSRWTVRTPSRSGGVGRRRTS